MTALAAQRPRSDLAVRVVVGIGLMLMAVTMLVNGGIPFWALVTAISLIMLREYGGLIGVDGWPRLLALAVQAAAFWVAQPKFGIESVQVAIAFPLAIVVVALVAGAAMAAGVVYTGVSALALLFVRDQYDGINLTLWAMMIVWATDIGAYFAGRAIGGARLAPRLSPNKTWAGLLGGMATALVVGVAAASILHVPLRLATLAGALALLAQMGDLFESWLKRRAGVKDSGALLPGHGGALDRLDGLIPVALAVALLLLAGYV